jgi:hypothetical protein
VKWETCRGRKTWTNTWMLRDYHFCQCNSKSQMNFLWWEKLLSLLAVGQVASSSTGIWFSNWPSPLLEICTWTKSGSRFVSNASPISERALLLGRFPGFARLPVWQVWYVDEDEYWLLMEWYWRENWSTWRKTCHCDFCPAQTSHGLVWDQTQAPHSERLVTNQLNHGTITAALLILLNYLYSSFPTSQGTQSMSIVKHAC